MATQLRKHEWIGGAAVIAGLIVCAALFFDRHLERGYLTLQYAQNFASGRGLVASGDSLPVLSGAVSPLFALLVAAGSSLSADLLAVSNLIGILSIGAGAAAVFVLMRSRGSLAASLSAATYSAFPVLWVSLGLETPLWLALGVWALVAYARQRWRAAAILLALMALIRLEGIILACVILADALASRRPIRLSALALFGGIAGLGYLILLGSFPASRLLPSLPPTQIAERLPDIIGANSLIGFAALVSSLVGISWAWIGALGLAMAGAVEARRDRPVILLGGWAVLCIIILLVLQVGVFAWTFAPIIPALATLIGGGVAFAADRLPAGWPRVAGSVAGALIVLSALTESALGLAWATPTQAAGWPALAIRQPDPNVRQVAEWIAAHTPPAATVGARGGEALGYFSRRAIVDYYGSLQPELADAFGRGDGGWWIARQQPDYLALSGSDYQSIDGYSPVADEWFASTYLEIVRFSPTGSSPEMVILQRIAPPRPMNESLINFVPYDDQLTLNGIASDSSLEPLEGGRMSLIRLEWLLSAPIVGSKSISIRIQSGDGAVLAALTTRDVDFTRWPIRKLVTTYHPIRVTEALPSGVYQVQVGIGSSSTDLDWKTVSRAKVPFEGATDLGGISGAQAEFGDIELIGYRVGRRETGLEVLLLWQAIRAPATDYRVLIQIRDAAGAVVAQQAIHPLNGAYPTSVWSAGEQVTDTALIDLSAIPAGEYDVMVGLLAPDESRVLTLDGQDAVFVGRVSIEP